MNNRVVIFPGRFQPFHPGHKSCYDRLVDEYGRENVYIATSNKVKYPESPFSFEEKVEIITSIYPDISRGMIVRTKQPYRPVEVIDSLPDDTEWVLAIGAKDLKRLRGIDRLYILTEKERISGTEVRQRLEESKDFDKVFEEIYGRKIDNAQELMKIYA